MRAQGYNLCGGPKIMRVCRGAPLFGDVHGGGSQKRGVVIGIPCSRVIQSSSTQISVEKLPKGADTDGPTPRPN